MFEVEGGHGQTLRTRRRIEDTRPSGVDPVNAPHVARGSQRGSLRKKKTSWRTEHLCGITIKCKWERDALRPGIRLFLVSHPQKVAWVKKARKASMLENVF